MAKKKKTTPNLIASNRRARHDYSIEETYEAGIVLVGTEVKSLRNGRANIGDAFVAIENGEAWLRNAHIDEYTFGNRFNHGCCRPAQGNLDRMATNLRCGSPGLVPRISDDRLLIDLRSVMPRQDRQIVEAFANLSKG